MATIARSSRISGFDNGASISNGAALVDIGETFLRLPPDTASAAVEPASVAIAGDIVNFGPSAQDTTRFVLSTGNFTQNWSSVTFSADDDWSNVSSIVGYRGDGLTGSTGTDPRTLTANVATPVVDVNRNQTTPNSFTTGGVTHFTGGNVGNDAVVALAGSGTATAPYLQFYLDSTGRQNVTVAFRVRVLESGTDNAVQQVALQYRTSPTGAWTNVPGGYIADATSGPSILGGDTNINVTLPSDADNQPQLELRIITTNAPGNDEWVGIDDIVISSSPGATTVTINDVSITEGDAGTSLLTFTITRSDNAGAFTLNYATADVTATAGSDYVAASGTAAFTAGGSLTQTVSITINGDTTPEANETFQVNLSGLVNTGGTAVITDAQGIGTILNDDTAPPSITINDVSIVEGNAGTSIAVFTVTRTGGTGAFSVDFATANGTATAGSDYVATSGTLTFGAGINSQTISVTINGDTVSELSETFVVNLSNPTNNAIFADAQGQGTIVNDDLTLISQIQGDSYYSPLLRASGVTGFNIASSTTVTVQAIVTAIDGVGNLQGFYLQEEVADWDGNPFTSEAIFVLTRNDANVGTAVLTAVPGLQVGDRVTLTANIQEYQGFSTNFPITALVNPTGITINSSNNALPVIVLDASRPIPNGIFSNVTPDFTDAVDDPGDSFDGANYAFSFWESLEGALVTVPDVRVADGFVTTSGGQPFFKAYSAVHADPGQINSRGGYTVAGDPPLSPPNTATTDDDTLRGGRNLTDGDQNPDIFELDFTGFATPAPAGLTTSASIGDQLGNVTGIISFDFQELKLFVTGIDPASFVDTSTTQETSTLLFDPRQLTVATFNVENLDPTDGAARFTLLAQAIATRLRAPDIISIEEIQDNNGAAAGDGTSPTGTDASTTWQMLVDALNLATGAHYQWVDELPVYNAEGGEQSGNIRVGFLYNTDRVQLGDLAANATIAERRQFTDRIGDNARDPGDRILYSDNQVAGINPADWSGTRRSLLGQFTFRGETVFVAANHFPSKLGSGNFWQFNQNIDAGQPANAGWNQRNQVAEDLYSVLNFIQTASPNAGIVTGGDFNEFYFYRPLEAATGYVFADGTARNDGARLTNLTLTLPEAERYTYTFDGRSQAIDHILVNSVLSGIASYDVVHINTGFNNLATGAPADRPLSDHDPAVAQFDFRQRAETLIGTTANETINGFGGNDTIDGNGGTDVLIGGLGDDIFIVDSLDDTVTENPGEGSDEVRTALPNYVLPANVERLTFTGSGTSNQRISGNAGDNVVTGGTGADSFDLSQGGNDAANGGSGDDSFFFGAAFTAADSVDGGLGNNDQIGLQGDYSGGLTLGAATISNVEVIAVLPGFSYNITTVDANVAAGRVLTVFGSNLPANNNFTFNGAAETDGAFRVYGGFGADGFTGGAGNDGFYFGPGRFGAGDFVDGRAGANDQLALDGNYVVTLGSGQVQNIEVLALLPGLPGDRGSYAITLADSLTGAGQRFTVFGLNVETSITLNGSGESDGRFYFIGGRAADTLIGGAGDDLIFGNLGGDTLTGGAGADTYSYNSAAESTSAARDRITDFAAIDRFDLSAIDADGNAGNGDTAFSFIGSAAFGNIAGQLRVSALGADWLIEADIDGNGVADFAVLAQGAQPLETQFVL